MTIKTGIVKDRISIDELVEDLVRETASKGGGAIVCFIGFVKGVVDNKKVYRLDYSAYEPYASKKLEEIAREEAEKHNLLGVRLFHRIGELEPGEHTIYIVVASRSRHEAFNGAKEILERVKREVPIYKLEHREDGDYWVIGDGERIKRRES